MDKIIQLLPVDGPLPWLLYDWFMACFWCVYVGYSELLGKSYTYELYIGQDIEGDHAFTFEWRK